MKLTYLGHAGFLAVNLAGGHLVMDPWLSKDGAFLRSWFQFPENHFLARLVTDLPPQDTVVYLSHHHRDHCDVHLLAQLDRSTTLIVPRFTRRHFVDELRSRGFHDVRELADRETLTLAGYSLTIYVDDSYSNEDSGLLVEADGCRFLNMNDCRAYDCLDPSAIAPLDLLTAQYSGASWYPDTYDYPPDEMRARAAAKNAHKFGNIRRVIERLNPRLYVPSAGPPCFLDPTLFDVNFGNPGSFPDAAVFLPTLHDTGVPAQHLFPGDRIVLQAGATPCIEPDSPFDVGMLEADAKRAYLRSYADRFQEQARLPRGAGEDQWERLRDAIVEKVAALPGPAQVAHRIAVTLEGRPAGRPARHLLVDLSRPGCEEVSTVPADRIYHFRYNNDTVEAFFATGVLWEELMLSLRFRVHRTPDRFDATIVDFMRLEAGDLHHRPSPQAAARIQVRAGECVYDIDRYCPHQQSDLSQARMVDGVLICARHGWEFDLARAGACSTADASIHAVLVSRGEATESPST